VETPPGRDSFGVVDVFHDRLVVKGVDTFASGMWLLKGSRSQGGVWRRAHAHEQHNMPGAPVDWAPRG
jgi:hypothetical protein